MKVLIATKNPAKIEGAERALKHFFEDVEIEGIGVESNVSEQPIDEETYEGAENRVNNLIAFANEKGIKADLFLAIEAGISNKLGRWCNFNIAVVKAASGNIGWGIGQAFPIPDRLVEKIKTTSLSEVMDSLFNEEGSGSKKGGIRYLTKGIVTRQDITEQAFIMALTTIINDCWKV